MFCCGKNKKVLDIMKRLCKVQLQINRDTILEQIIYRNWSLLLNKYAEYAEEQNSRISSSLIQEEVEKLLTAHA